MTEVMKFFGLRAGEFRNEWAAMTEQDKKELREGIKSGSLTY